MTLESLLVLIILLLLVIYLVQHLR